MLIPKIHSPDAQLQPFSEPELVQLDNAIGNHDAKLLTAGIFALNPNQIFIKTALSREINNRQAFKSDTPKGITYKQFIENSGGWVPHDGVARSYCVNSLQPIGAVIDIPTIGKRGFESAWRATELGRRSLAYIGANSGWSLDYPTKSLQRIRGQSISKAPVRSPEVRQSIYATLLKYPGEPTSYVDIASRIGKTTITAGLIGSVASDLVDLDILTITSKLDNSYNPSFKILDPTFSHVGLKFADLQPASRVMYMSLTELYKQSHHSTLHGLLEVAKRLDPTVDLAAIRRRFTMGISTKTTNQPGIELGKGEMPPERKDEVHIAPDYVVPIKDLVQRRDTLKDETLLQNYSTRAVEILTSQFLFRQLMGKAAHFSTNRVAQLEKRSGLEDRIVKILNDFDVVTAHEVRQHLKERGRTVTLDSARGVLVEMAANQKVKVSNVQLDSSKRGTVLGYSLAEVTTD